MSDCWAILDFHEHHHVTKTVEESAAMAVNHGCDLNCGKAFLYLSRACEQGLVEEKTITEAVERLMDVRIRLGMMEDYPSPYANIPYDVVECPEHIALSLEASKRSMVLLKNDNHFLPLKQEQIHTIAVIGPNANSRAALVGNYEGTSSRYITPLEGIQEYTGEKTRVLYAQGCHLYKDQVEFLGEPKDRFKEALIAAERADVIVMCLGLDAGIEGEEGDAGNEYASGDKLGLKLPGLQQELLEAVAAVGKPIVLTVLAGSALDLSWAQEHAQIRAILDCWYPGARGGKAIAEALFGEFSPCGKLPVTFYEGTEFLPDFTDYSMAGRTYRYTDRHVLYPFGYGLTYSQIRYSDAHADVTDFGILEPVTVHVTVENTGTYPVQEAVQVYVRFSEREAYDPGYQLKGIRSVALECGEKKEVCITLSTRDFALISEEGKCLVHPGSYEIAVGGQQPDERSSRLTGQTVSTLFICKTGNVTEVEY